MTGLDFTQLGVAGCIVVVLLLWVKLERDDHAATREELKQVRDQNHADQAAMVPALTTAAAAVQAANAALIEIARATATGRAAERQ